MTVLLQQHLQAVGDAVEQPQPDQLDLRERNAHVGAVGADAIGHHRRLLALDPGQQRAEGHQHAERVADEDERRRRGPGSCAASRWRRASAANSASASATAARLREAGARRRSPTPSKLV